MIRTKNGLKQLALLGFFGLSVSGIACSDDDDEPNSTFAGQPGDAGSAGKPGGGASSAGTSAGGTKSTAGNAGTATGGSAGSGTAGAQASGGESNGGSGGSDAGGSDSGGSDGGGGEAGAASMGGTGQAGEPSGNGGQGGEGVVFDVLDNPGFESGTDHVDIPGWTNEGSTGAAFIQHSDAHGGTGRLGHWSMWFEGAPAYTARTYQTVSPIANGTYSFSVWVNRDWFDGQYLFAKGFNSENLEEQKTVLTEPAAAENGYTKITLTGIVVTSGSVTVGIDSAAPAGTWANFDDAELTLE